MSDLETTGGGTEAGATTSAMAAPRTLAGVGVASIPAVLDQALFATTNFVLSLQLARTVTHAEFGAFTLWLSVLVLLGTIYASVVIGPMLVYGTTRYADDLRGYLGGLCRAHVPLVLVPSSVALALAGALAIGGQRGFAAYLAALAVAAPGVLLLWLARSACFVRASTRYLAPAAGAAYLVVVLAIAQVLRSSALTGPRILGAMGAAGLLCGGVVLALLRADVRGRSDRTPMRPELDNLRFSVRSLYAAHRTFGFWLLAITVVTWLMLNAYPFLIRSFSSLADAGGFQADMNLLAPLFQGTSAICILFMPMLAAARPTRDFRRLVRSLVWLLGAGGAIFWALMAAFGDQVVRLTYGESYVDRASILPVLASVCVLNAVAGAYGSGLRAIERPAPVFRAYAWSAAVLVVAGVALIPSMGLDGAALGTVMAWIVALGLLRRSCWHEWRSARRADARPTPATAVLDLSLVPALWGGDQQRRPTFAPTAAPFEATRDAMRPSLFANPAHRLGPVGAVDGTDETEPADVTADLADGTSDAAPAVALTTREIGRRRVVKALLSLAPICLVVLSLDHRGAFTRGSFVRNLLPLGLLLVIGAAYVLSGQGSIARPTWADRALLALIGFVSLGYVLRLYSGNAAESGISIALGLLLAASHLLVVGTPTAAQCRRALRDLTWAGTFYAAAFLAANLGLLGPEAPTFFKQMQSGILIVPLAAAVLSRRWAPAAFVAATYAYGFLHYSGADTHRSAGHGGTYLVVAAVAGLVYLVGRGATRSARVLRTLAVVVLVVGAFLAVRASAPPTSAVGSVAAATTGGNDSSAFRADVWGVAADQIADRPVIGGAFAGTIAVTVDKYGESDLLVHNDLLQLALDGGLLAAGLYLFVIIDANRRALRCGQRLRRGHLRDHGNLLMVAFIGFDAFVVVGLFNPAMFTASVSSIGFAMYAVLRLLDRTAPDDRPPPRRASRRPSSRTVPLPA